MGLETGALMNEINVLVKGIPESLFPLPCEDISVGSLQSRRGLLPEPDYAGSSISFSASRTVRNKFLSYKATQL